MTPDAAPQTVPADFLGLLAQGSLVAFGQAAAASALAPSTDEKLVLARLAGERLDRLGALEADLAARGASLGAAMQPFAAPADEFTRHTATTRWAESLVGLCVLGGLACDFAAAVRGNLGPDLAPVLDTTLDGGGLAGEPERLLARVLADQPELRDRLALFGRRLLAEALSQVQRIAASHDGLTALLSGAGDDAGSLAAISRLMSDLAATHARRMAALGLA